MTDAAACSKGHPKTPDNWTGRYCRECKRVADAARRGTELGPRRVYDPSRFPCGHPRVEDNFTSRHQCRECSRIKSNKVAERKRAERIAKYGPGRRPSSAIDPERFTCGHPRTPENTKRSAEGWSSGCRECNRAKKRADHRARQDAAGRPPRVVDPKRFPCGHPRTARNTKFGGYGCKECNRIKTVQCARDERADPETAAYVQIVRRDPCSYCTGPGGTRDHVIPMADAGPNHWTNYTGACLRCNTAKSDTPLLMFLLDRQTLRQARENRRSA